jgi:formate hydrogenlyase subunit 6/NADH:ubiquinone oxidoreductase subunit I
MDTEIFWFSATGNSLAAAKGLAERLGDARLRPMIAEAGGGRSPSSAADRVGFVFPLYYLGCPKVVYDFLSAFSAKDGADLFCVVTRGVRPTGGALRDVKKRLARRGLALRFGAYVDMPNNDATLFAPTGEAEAAERLAAVPARLDEVAKGILSCARHLDFEPTAFMLPIRQAAYGKRIASSHEKWRAEASCTGCGSCAKACPLGLIRMEGGKPAWSRGCQECEACINWCPAKAIQYEGGNTEGKGRYRHPGVALAEITGQRAR